MNKKIMSYALATAMVGSLFTLNVQALEQNTESISLPVQLYDYNADGLFYEYALYKGMDTFGLGTSDNEGETTGLIADQLGKDGLPVYKKATVESAAKTIQDNLIAGKAEKAKGNVDPTHTYLNYDIFNHFLNMSHNAGKGKSVAGAFGGISKYFYNNGWVYDGDSSYSNGYVYENNRKGIIWEQDTNGVNNYKVSGQLTRTISGLTPNTKCKLYYWGGDADKGYEVKIFDNGNLLATGKDVIFEVPESGAITVQITEDADNWTSTDTVAKIADMKIQYLDDSNNTISETENYLGDNSPGFSEEKRSNFIKEGWVSSDDTYTKSETFGIISDGEVYWRQSTDGVACLKGSSIIYQTSIPTGQIINLNYYVGWNGYNADGFTIDILDGNGNPLLQNIKLVETEGGPYQLSVDVPDGYRNIKIKINGKAGSKIANLGIDPVGDIVPLGNYDSTVSKYNAGNLTKVEDCETCMDYAYLRLKNFYNTDFYLNKADTKYSQMVLKGKYDNEKKTVDYYFDSSKKINYNDNGTLENADSDEKSPGFFPLDHLTDELHSDQKEQPQNHNYHFGMKVDGDFIYKKGAKQFFEFSGDDDVYVFINGELAIDLGGAHKESSQSLDIEQYAIDHGIKNGEKCHFQMFYLERHTIDSNCKIQTNLNIGKRVEYKFESGTEGKELPDEILDLTPFDDHDYFDGTTVKISDEHKKFDQVIDQKNNGVWKFIGWDKESKVMEGDGIQFIGKWIFVSNDETKPSDPTDNQDPVDKPKEPTNDNKQNQKENNNNQTEQVTPVISNNKVVQVTTNNKQQKKSSKVKTGDNTSLVIYGTFVVISALGILFLKKKAHN